MGSPIFTMKMEGFFLLLLMALQVQGMQIPNNSSRAASGHLWAMADNVNDIHNKIFAKLRTYALSCCAYNIQAGQLTGNCNKMQLGYWAYIPDDAQGSENELFGWLDQYFNPDYTGANKRYYCQGGPSNLDFAHPFFAAAPPGTSGNGHTEATLLKPMAVVAESQANRPSDFFLYSVNSPCCTLASNNCQ